MIRLHSKYIYIAQSLKADFFYFYVETENHLCNYATTSQFSLFQPTFSIRIKKAPEVQAAKINTKNWARSNGIHLSSGKTPTLILSANIKAKS